MAWWKTGDGDDVCGDEPADRMAEALEALVGGGDSGTRTELAHILRVWQDALNSEARSLLGDDPAIAFSLVADVSPPNQPGERRTVHSADTPGSVGERRIALEALRGVSLSYQDAVGRKPRRSELAACLAFGLALPAEMGRFAEGRLRIGTVQLRPISPTSATGIGGQR